MKTGILIFLTGFLFIGCSHEDMGIKNESLMLVDTTTYETSFDLDKMDTILKQSDILEVTVKNTIKTDIRLKKENKTLKKENEVLKDSVSIMVNELKIVETKVMEAKKRNLFQKVFNIAPDSVEITKIDTIK